MTQPRGPDGRFGRKYGVLFAAGALGVVTAVGLGTGSGGAGLGTGARGVTVSDSPTLSAQVRSTRGQQRSARAQRNLAVRGLRGQLRAQGDSETCAANARGQVRDFLATHPCQSVYRALLQVRRGDYAAVVAVAWVEMVELRDAGDLKALVDRPGTGNVNQLRPPRGVRVIDLVEPAYASRRDGRLVTTVEVQPVAVTVPQRVLESIAEEALANAPDGS